MKNLDPDRTIIAIGSYGYDWVQGPSRPGPDLRGGRAVGAGFGSRHRVRSGDATTRTSPSSRMTASGTTSGSSTASRPSTRSTPADTYHPAGYALWRLGSEDPSIWSVLGRPYNAPAPDDPARNRHQRGYRLRRRGRDSARGRGARRRRAEPSRSTQAPATSSTRPIQAVPTPFVIERTGDKPGKLALTFDDGPDPDWTPKILDILKDKGVHASFFIIGDNARSQSGPRAAHRSPRVMTSATTPSPIPISASFPTRSSRSRSTPPSGCSRR